MPEEEEPARQSRHRSRRPNRPRARLTQRNPYDAEDWPREVERTWSLGLHVDQLFIQRGNFYLLGHSMFVVAYAGVLTGAFSSSTHHSAFSWVARVLAGFGLLLALVWLYVSHIQWSYLKFLRSRMSEQLPNYERIQTGRPQGFVEDGAMSAYIVPSLAAVMWLVLMLLA